MKFTYNEELDVYINDETGETISSEDFEYEYWVCDGCGEAFRYDDEDYANCDGAIYCRDCAEERDYVQCEKCGAWILKRDAVFPVDRDDLAFCDKCADQYLWYCDDCGNAYYDEDQLTWDDDNECDYCDACYDKHHNARIRYYHDFKDNECPEFFGSEQRSDVPYLGFELEVDKGYDSESALDSIQNQDFPRDFFHFEEDGSLDTGFEIISQPASINYHIAQSDEYAKAWHGVVGAGYSSHNAGTCGLHVHVDREYFGKKEDTSIAKILFMMERHWDNFVRFSRRKQYQMHWCDRYGTTPKDTVKMGKERVLGRYFALNLTNDNTIEFRLWRGTLNPVTFMATIKLTARICEIAKNTDAVTLAKMKWDDILGDDETIRTYWNTRIGNTEPINEQ